MPHLHSPRVSSLVDRPQSYNGEDKKIGERLQAAGETI